MKLPKRIVDYFDSQALRDAFVNEELRRLPDQTKILDAGCGNQRYRKLCNRLDYYAQDFAGYKQDQSEGFTDAAGGASGYKYGELDFVGDIWSIDVEGESFDAILCTEVFEHIPYPVETVKEFSRLLKPGGKLILTAPSNCLRHMDPYYYYSGFSNHWFSEILSKHGFDVELLEQIGDYYKFLAIEVGRTGWHHGLLAKLILAPAFLYYFFKIPTVKSRNTLCLGYHIVARKK